jgi:NAD(P)-dependent dehydrogenase (short-subunit alcohol dehydrogenase family)
MNPPERKVRVAPSIPIGRAGRPEELEVAVLFLVSEDASYMVGAPVVVSGGR